MAKQFKKGQISATRAYEIADSLTKRAQLKHGAIDFRAKELKNAKSSSEKSYIKNIMSSLWDSGEKDYNEASRLKSLADKAMNKAKGRDIPLPSSDKLF